MALPRRRRSDQLNVHDRRRVPFAPTELQDARVSTLPIAVFRRNTAEERVRYVLIVQETDSLASSRQRTVFPERDGLLHDGSHFLGSGLGGPDTPVLQKRARKISQKLAAVIRLHAQLSSFALMPHRLLSSELKTEARQSLAHLVDTLLTEVGDIQKIALRSGDKISNRLDALALETVK